MTASTVVWCYSNAGRGSCLQISSPCLIAYFVVSDGREDAMKAALAQITVVTLAFLLGSAPGFALDPSLDVSQYAHTAWTVRQGFFKGSIYAISQTPDGYLWVGTEFGLLRFDGVRAVPLPEPADKRLFAGGVSRLLGARDGTLWIGTFIDLLSLSKGQLVRHPELGTYGVMSLLEGRDGTIWAGSFWQPKGRLCAFRAGGAQCYGDDGEFGNFVATLLEDSSGALWVGAQTGLWRWDADPARRRRIPRNHMRSLSEAESGLWAPGQLNSLKQGEGGQLLAAAYARGLVQLGGGELRPYPIRSAVTPNRYLRETEVNSNLLLRDRDGGLWIGTVERGLIHVHNGRTDVFTRSNGLSGDVILTLFEDREGSIWVGTTGGLDRFRELPFTSISVREGLASDDTKSVLAASDGSIWVGTHDGVTRWKDGQVNTFRKASGLPDDAIQSLYQDSSGRIWAFTGGGLAYLEHGRFVASKAVMGGEVHWMTGDRAGNLWLAENRELLHLRQGSLVERIPLPQTGRPHSAKILLPDRAGGLWLGFWRDGGITYFKDGQVRASYTIANGLTGPVSDLQFGRDGALWIATEWGGLNRLKDGHIVALTTRNGLPCDVIHWSVEDDDGSYWLNTACGLVRIRRAEVEAWIADPKRRVETTTWDAADGVRLRSFAASNYGPRIAKASDGKLWFVTGEGVQVIDPRRLVVNQLPPPIHIEKILADKKLYWQNISGAAPSNLRLPARTHDLQIEFTALSLVAQEKVHFKYMLEGQDQDWKEVINERQAKYTNLAPRKYVFRVIAGNNSGVWNEAGDTLEFSIAPAWNQTTWFYAACVAAFLAATWGLYRLRLYQIAREFNAQLDGRVDERLRVARDLHDTMLQTFQAALIQMQAGYNLLSRSPERAAKTLQEAITTSAAAIVEGREAIQNMRSSAVTENDLARALRVAGDQMATEGSARFDVRVQGPSRDVHPILRDDVYRIALEALRNAFKHAEAKAIEAEIVYGDSLRVRIRDDGKGIASAIMEERRRSGHYGIRGMRERAERVGGKLEVWSAAGAGTEIQLSIPGNIAFGKPGAGSLFRRFRRKSKSSAAAQS